MSRFDRDDYIFRDQDVLDTGYEPEELEERDDELDAYANALRPVIKGWNPNNIFVYGDTGIGKTVTTHAILKDLYEASEQYDDLGLNIIELNCTNTTSSYQVAIHLVNEIRKPEDEKEPLTTVTTRREPMSETGYQAKRVFNELYKDLNDIGGTILIVLDEIDSIGDDDALLYELPRAHTITFRNST
nr:AAA family ATPase [Halomarina sp. BND7]